MTSCVRNAPKAKSVEAVEDALKDLKINKSAIKINGWEELHKLGLE